MDTNNNISFKDIRLPSSNHRWGFNQNSEEVGKIDRYGLFQSQDELGRADIQVIDQRFQNNTADAEIHVVEADSMQAVISDVTQEFKKIGRHNFKQAQSLQH